MKSDGMLEIFLKYATLAFSIANIACGLPIVLGLLTPRQLVPKIMSAFDVCVASTQEGYVSPPERLYNIVFGLLAVQIGLIRLFGFWFWSSCSDANARFPLLVLLMTTFSVELARDSIMHVEGWIDLSEAVALVPSMVFLAGYAFSLYLLAGSKEKTK